MGAKLSAAQQSLLAVLDRYDDEDWQGLDLVRPGDLRTARSLERLGLVTAREGVRPEDGFPVLYIKKVQP